jgi:hypothetical protein
MLGDEDTRFYHARASARLRVNSIESIEVDGTRFFTHKEKEKGFTVFYRNIMGSSTSTQSLIELGDLYPNPTNLTFLCSPFSVQEIYKALKEIPRDKSPDPDGFGSGFYKDFWSLVKPDILSLFTHFFNGELQLDTNKGGCLHSGCIQAHLSFKLSG